MRLCFRWLDKNIGWTTTKIHDRFARCIERVSMGKSEDSVEWTSPQKKYKVHTVYWYVYGIFLYIYSYTSIIIICVFDQAVQTLYEYIYIYLYICTHILYIYIYMFQVIRKKIPRPGHATCARAAAFVAHRTASRAGRVVAQRVENTLRLNFSLVAGKHHVGWKLHWFWCVKNSEKVGKGMVCVQVFCLSIHVWCQSALLFLGWTDTGKIMMKICGRMNPGICEAWKYAESQNEISSSNHFHG